MIRETLHFKNNIRNCSERLSTEDYQGQGDPESQRLIMLTVMLSRANDSDCNERNPYHIVCNLVCMGC